MALRRWWRGGPARGDDRCGGIAAENVARRPQDGAAASLKARLRQGWQGVPGLEAAVGGGLDLTAGARRLGEGRGPRGTGGSAGPFRTGIPCAGKHAGPRGGGGGVQVAEQGLNGLEGGKTSDGLGPSGKGGLQGEPVCLPRRAAEEKGVDRERM
jgi:hypothetical protein